MDVGRRTLLQAALGTSVAAAGGTAVPTPAAAQSDDGRQPGGDRPDGTGSRFTLAVLPDTQYLFDQGGSDPEPVREALRHVVRRRREDRIAFLAHLGDVTENYGSDVEFATADDAFRTIDRRVPYSVQTGNHDIDPRTDDTRGPTPYSRTFGPGRFSGDPTYGGSSADGYNSVHRFDAAGRRWLLLALDWRVSDVGLAWARGVLDADPTMPTIVTVHELVAPAGEGGAELSEHGRRIWEGLIRPRDQVFLAIGGHYWPPGRTVATNDFGNEVHLHVTNYQDRYYGGAGMLRYYSFDLDRDAIDVQTFSPWLQARRDRADGELEAENAELTDDVNRFSLALDFLARFGPPPPAPRPPAQLLVRDTVAYWRFDQPGAGADGTPIGLDAVIPDLTGEGNDLRPQRLNDSPAEVLTWSAEFERDQPGHASVRFDGGQDPDRGAVLRTGDAAPLNSRTFESGYTIETFFKLPEPFVGAHAFMGMLSWEGRAGDAGKTGGYSPDEATCSVNVSGERFLQFVAYPVDVDDDPTSWSHAIPTGRWTHLAIVNDGRRTIVHVDGSPIGRNANPVGRGIATLGLPFAIGGTQFAGRYGQGFYGWIGDTRIAARALRRDEWLTVR